MTAITDEYMQQMLAKTRELHSYFKSFTRSRWRPAVAAGIFAYEIHPCRGFPVIVYHSGRCS